MPFGNGFTECLHFVARRSQPHFGGMLPPRASPQAKLGATNVIVFMFMTT